MPSTPEVPIPELVARRLAALAEAKCMPVEDLVADALTALTSSPEARRTILVFRNGSSLADLGWVDGYDGQSVDAVLAFADSEDARELLTVLEHAIQQRWEIVPEARTGVENIVMAVMALIREVNNGGFDQFFRNSSRRWALFASDAMVHVGRRDAAKIAARALRAVRIPKDAGSEGLWETFDQRMNTPDARRDAVLNECDLLFWSLAGLPESLLVYARNHRDGLLPM